MVIPPGQERSKGESDHTFPNLQRSCREDGAKLFSYMNNKENGQQAEIASPKGTTGHKEKMCCVALARGPDQVAHGQGPEQTSLALELALL